MKRMRVRSTDNIICYDNMGIFSSPRVAFTLRYFGADRVRVLNGGFKKWLQENRETQSGEEFIDELEQDGDYNYKVVNDLALIQDINEMH